MAFGPDGDLYLSIGYLAQDYLGEESLKAIGLGPDVRLPGSLVAAIHRYTPKGETPKDNPIPNSPVFAYGFRNPYGLAFLPKDGHLYATDNGWYRCCDRVIRIERGGNHGWPQYGWDLEDMERMMADPTVVKPLYYSKKGTPAPTQLLAYGGDRYGEQFRNNLFFSTFHDAYLHRMVLSDDGRTLVQHEIAWATEPMQPMVGITATRGGYIYFATFLEIYRINKL